MGVTMTQERRQRLYEFAVKYDISVIEDSPYFELSYSGEIMTPIKALDKTGHIIYAGSFSKVISPGLRLGYAVAPAELIAKMTVAKQGEDVCNNQLTMVSVSRYLERYDLDEHIKDCCAAYAKKRNYMLECIDNTLIRESLHKARRRTFHLVRPAGGLFRHRPVALCAGA